MLQAFLISALDGCEWSVTSPRSLFSLYTRLGGSQDLNSPRGEEKKVHSQPGIEP